MVIRSSCIHPMPALKTRYEFIIAVIITKPQADLRKRLIMLKVPVPYLTTNFFKITKDQKIIAMVLV